jgi:hypothetical protein
MDEGSNSQEDTFSGFWFPADSSKFVCNEIFCFAWDSGILLDSTFFYFVTTSRHRLSSSRLIRSLQQKVATRHNTLSAKRDDVISTVAGFFVSIFKVLRSYHKYEG